MEAGPSNHRPVFQHCTRIGPFPEICICVADDDGGNLYCAFIDLQSSATFCPKCEVKYPDREFRLPEDEAWYSSHFDQTFFPCQYGQYGCMKLISRSAFPAHARACQFRNARHVPCPANNLDSAHHTVAYHGLEHHLRSEHPDAIWNEPVVTGEDLVGFEIYEWTPAWLLESPLCMQRVYGAAFAVCVTNYREHNLVFVYAIGDRYDARRFKSRIRMRSGEQEEVVKELPVFPVDQPIAQVWMEIRDLLGEQWLTGVYGMKLRVTIDILVRGYPQRSNR